MRSVVIFTALLLLLIPSVYSQAPAHQGDSLLTLYYSLDDWQQAERAELHFKDSLLHGPVKVWYCCGEERLYCEGQYEKGRKTGEWTFYCPNGEIREQGMYDPALETEGFDLQIGPFEPYGDTYGYDTLSNAELEAIGPLMNMALVSKRELGRKGIWKMTDCNEERNWGVDYGPYPGLELIEILDNGIRELPLKEDGP